MPTARRFTFTDVTKFGEERLILANLDRLIPLWLPTARTIATMGTVPGEIPSDGQVPERYTALLVRPDNALVAVASAQLGIDFIDFNIAVYEMESGTQTVRFNEHSVAGVNRANCPSTLFNAFLASEAALGVPQAQLDSYDYGVEVEGTGIGDPTLAWSTTGTLIVSYGFDVIAANSFLLGQERFTFEIAPMAAVGGGLSILSRNAAPTPVTQPTNPFRIAPISRLSPAPDHVIHYGKRPVSFDVGPLTKWTPRFWPRPVKVHRSATHVAGYVR